MRDILLGDLDAFFAAVEQRDHPEYRGRPVIVGGRPGERGVVSTCSYEARVFGVRSAMPVTTAVRLCPQAVFLPVNMTRYREVSARVLAIYERFTPELEPASIDEVYLAVPAGQGKEVAAGIRRTIRGELSLPVTVGVAANKLLAKIACELAKPDGMMEIRPEDVPRVVWPLPVKVLPGVGPRTEERLHRMAIHTVGQLAAYPERLLVSSFGKFGTLLHEHAGGIDHRPLTTSREPVSVSEETTFREDLPEQDQALTVLLDLSEQVGRRLRRQGLRARTITVKVRFTDFRTITRSRTLPQPVDGDAGIYRAARDLFLTHGGSPPWRLLGVAATNFARVEQLSLLPDESDRDTRVSKTVDEVREKYGRKALGRAKTMLENPGQP